MKFRLGELFCGPGGLALGAISADIGRDDCRIVHAWASDYDSATCETYRRNICPDDPQSVICEDVHALALETLGPIDALAFGFPCNDFSTVGQRRGLEGKFGPLYSYGIEALKIYKPMWFLAENVVGLKSANDCMAFRTITKAMNEAGYRLYPHLYEFERYGVPQARHRIIIVGIRKDLPYSYNVPKPLNRLKTCREAICDPPIDSNAPNHEFAQPSNIVVERLKHIKPGENAFTSNLPSELQLNVSRKKFSQIYKRLDPNKPAYTVTGSGGGGTYIYHWNEPRALTNRERARLQTFPDSYIFAGSKEQVRKQIGMAVPPMGAKIIFEAILKSFASIPYPSIPTTEATLS